MLTFKQFVAQKHRDAAQRHGITLAETKTELPAAIYRQEWRDYVVRSFNNGEDIPTRLWNSLDEGLQYRVKRSQRGLRNGDYPRP